MMMFKKPEESRMTKEESEAYGRKINEQSAKFENVEVLEEESVEHEARKSPELTDAEIKKRVGDQNFKNMQDDDTMGSINS